MVRLPFRILKDAIWKYYEDDGPFMARGLAFGLLIYCIPLALLTVSVLSYTLVGSDRALAWVRGVSLSLMPQFYDEFTSYLTSIVNNRGLLGAAGRAGTASRSARRRSRPAGRVRS